MPNPLVYCQGTLLFTRRGAQREIISDGEDGVKPSRCRHCKRGVILHNATDQFVGKAQGNDDPRVRKPS